jgi:acyl-CoA synthetase (AMP-forming)/AMP-acid ligase II
MDNARYEDLAGRLYGLVIRLSDRMPADGAGWVHHVTEVGKYALALEDLAAILAHGKTAITDRERADMPALGRGMTLRQDLADVLGACPRAGEDHGPGQQIDHAM